MLPQWFSILANLFGTTVILRNSSFADAAAET